MSDDLKRTQHIDREELSELRRATASGCPDCAKQRAYIRGLREQLRRQAQDSELQRLGAQELARRAYMAEANVQARERLLTRERLINAEVLQRLLCGVSVWKPGGELYYQNPAATELVDLVTPHEPTTLEEYSEQVGLAYDSEGGILKSSAWPPARALRGETVEDYIMIVNNVPLRTHAYPLSLPAEASLWALMILEPILS